MSKGRKKIPTKIKEKQGTLRKHRELPDEMQVAQTVSMPNAPMFLNEYGVIEWHKTTNQLADIGMLYEVDLALLAAYCREMGMYIEMSLVLKDGQVERTYDKDGLLRATKTKPEVRIQREALDRALKIATQFGFTPSARASIPQNTKEEEQKSDYDFF